MKPAPDNALIAVLCDAIEEPQRTSALVVLKELREAISDFNGHGMPGFTDRTRAYIVMRQADEVLNAKCRTNQASAGSEGRP